MLSVGESSARSRGRVSASWWWSGTAGDRFGVKVRGVEAPWWSDGGRKVGQRLSDGPAEVSGAALEGGVNGVNRGSVE